MKSLLSLTLVALIGLVAPARAQQGVIVMQSTIVVQTTIVVTFMSQQTNFFNPLIGGRPIYSPGLRYLLLEAMRIDAANRDRQGYVNREVERIRVNDEWNKFMGYEKVEEKPLVVPVTLDPVKEAEKQAEEEKRKLEENQKAAIIASKLIPFTGLCYDVTDGDTFVVRRGQEMQTVKIYGVEAPEVTQPRGEQIKAIIKKWLVGEYVSIAPKSVADDGSIIAVVAMNKSATPQSRSKLNVGIAADLLQAGYAWRQPSVTSPTGRYAQYEQAAQVSRAGVWGDANPISPWEWRETHEAKN